MDSTAEKAGIRPAQQPAGRGAGRLLLAAALLVPFLALAAGAAWSWRTTWRGALEDQDRLLSMLHEHARRAFEVQEVLLVATARHFRGQEIGRLAGDAAAHDFLRAVRDAAAVSGGLGLVRPDGRLAASSYAFPAPPIDLSDRDYVQAHLAGERGTFVGRAVMARPSDVRIFAISRPVEDAAGRLAGIVGSGFAVSYFADFHAGILPGPGQQVWLLRTDGALLASHPAQPIDAWLTPGDPLLDLPGPDAARRLRLTRDGQEMVFATRRVAHHPVLIAHGLPVAEIRAQWLSGLGIAAAIATGSAGLLLLAATRAIEATTRERRALEAARAAAEARAAIEVRLRHAQRLEALGQLTSGVAHEVNNLLTVVRGAAGSLRRTLPEAGERAQRYLDALDQAVARGQGLTGRLLAVARREAPQRERLDLAAWLPAREETLRAALRDRAVLAFDLPARAHPVRVEAHELEAALINLAANARDAIAAGGRGHGRFTVSLRDAGPDAVEITCADDGPGMPEAVAARALEPFFTTKPGQEGTGLGLPQVAAFAADAGGRLRLETAPGQGTRVTLRLPRDAD